jgi:cytochrome c-type biogenesis protein CcmF
MNILASGADVWLGKLGQLSIITMFVTAIICSILYILAIRNKSESHNFLRFARKWYFLHVISVVLTITLLLTAIYEHKYIYAYVWKHSSNALPFKYLLSALWEGQEGSTLLWIFWHSLLGLVLLFRSKDYAPYVMSVLLLAQVMLSSMILGFHTYLPHIELSPLGFSWEMYKMGSNPFALLKDSMHIPIFQMNPDYVFDDGNGLNPLLQNYWMVIHPPTLFLGFAGCTIPFAFVISGLYRKDFKSWLVPTHRWALFTLMVLGAGILMGGAWAYEALSFGGFWAWDPVENASLVPWLLLAAGLHALLIYKHTGYSILGTILFISLSFLLIMYSSFLTKSGILGDSSVHSFTDMGMSAQLILSIVVFLIPTIYLIATRYTLFPKKEKEEATSSREFWMFVGSLVFFISATHIIIFTSFPVINKIIHTQYAPPKAAHYNQVEIWMAIMAAILAGIAQYFSYISSSLSQILKKLAISLMASLVLSLPIIIFYEFYSAGYALLAICAVFVIISNILYIKNLKIKKFAIGSVLAHIGFGLMLIGILISQGRQQVISLNRFGIDYGDGFTEEEKVQNILLYKGEPQSMKNFRVTYIGDSVVLPNVYFKVLYEKFDDKGKVVRSFLLKPNVQINQKMGNVANPSTYKAFDRDIYTHITSAPLKNDGSPEDSVRTEKYMMAIGDTVAIGNRMMVLNGINPNAHSDNFQLQSGDIAVGAQLQILESDNTYPLQPIYFIRGNVATSIPATDSAKSAQYLLTKILPEEGKIEITTEQKLRKFIIMKAIVFPHINILWTGCIVMTSGFFVSLLMRMKSHNRAKN